MQRSLIEKYNLISVCIMYCFCENDVDKNISCFTDNTPSSSHDCPKFIGGLFRTFNNYNSIHNIILSNNEKIKKSYKNKIKLLPK